MAKRGWGDNTHQAYTKYIFSTTKRFRRCAPGTSSGSSMRGAFFELLLDPAVDLRVKLMDYAKLKWDVFEFCRFYEGLVGVPLAGRLKSEIQELLEEAVWLHGRLWAIDVEGVNECGRPVLVGPIDPLS